MHGWIDAWIPIAFPSFFLLINDRRRGLYWHPNVLALRRKKKEHSSVWRNVKGNDDVADLNPNAISTTVYLFIRNLPGQPKKVSFYVKRDRTWRFFCNV